MRCLFSVLLVVLLSACGCATQSQMRKEFEAQQSEYGQKFVHANSREERINVLKDYLQVIDGFQKRGCAAIRYGVARGFVEARIATIYEELGDSQSSSKFMAEALADYHQDPQYKDMDEASLRHLISEIDARNKQDGQSPEH